MTTKNNNTNGTNGLSRTALRRKREKEQRFQTILAVAETLFATRGFHGTSMETIAQEAEVSVGTVYFYFKNKEDLLVRLLDNIAFHMRELLGSEFTSAKGSLDGFRRAGLVFFEDFCPKHAQKLLIIFRESAGQGPRVEKRRREILVTFTSDVRGALERLSQTLGKPFKSPIAAEVMAISIMGMYERIAYEYVIWQDRSHEMNAVAQDALAFIMGGIANLWAES